MTEEQRIKHREYQKTYCLKHHDRVLESQRRWVENHPDKIFEYQQKYCIGSDSSWNIRRRKNRADSIEECDKDIYRQRWTVDETLYLIENYQDKTIKELSIEMGRTISSIERKRNRLGLKKGEN